MTKETFRPRVDESNILKQMVRNIQHPLEFFRESTSNSQDASANEINIELISHGGEMYDVIFEDDGDGMTKEEMPAFFAIGESQKTTSARIGEKGLGTLTLLDAGEVIVESRSRENPGVLTVGIMLNPADAVREGKVPEFSIEENPSDYESSLTSHGTKITLREKRIPTFNGKKVTEAEEIRDRLLHYLRTKTAAGTVKNRHATKSHVVNSIHRAMHAPTITLEVVTATGRAHTPSPVAGYYQIPDENLAPTGGVMNAQNIEINSDNFCAILDFSGSKTFSVGGKNHTVYYDGTAITAGESVRKALFKHESRQGVGQKSLGGIQLCKDFIPLGKNDLQLSRDLFDEYYYETVVFLNCQHFELNADRNAVTNIEADDIAWIFEDFKDRHLHNILKQAEPYKSMRKEEKAATDSVIATERATEQKDKYKSATDLSSKVAKAALKYTKVPQKEADVSHLLAMMVQSGKYNDVLEPIAKFGQYIDSSTDTIMEDATGKAFLVEIEYVLPNLFYHRHPMGSYELVVTWSLGGLGDGDKKTAPWGTDGTSVEVTLKKGADGWFLKWGTHTRRVIVLEEII